MFFFFYSFIVNCPPARNLSLTQQTIYCQWRKTTAKSFPRKKTRWVLSDWQWDWSVINFLGGYLLCFFFNSKNSSIWRWMYFLLSCDTWKNETTFIIQRKLVGCKFTKIKRFLLPNSFSWIWKIEKLSLFCNQTIALNIFFFFTKARLSLDIIIKKVTIIWFQRNETTLLLQILAYELSLIHLVLMFIIILFLFNNLFFLFKLFFKIVSSFF